VPSLLGGLAAGLPAQFCTRDLGVRRPPFRELGTYKGDNRLVYFDINDFDEAVLAACTFDVTREVDRLAPCRASAVGHAADPDRRFR